MNVHLGIVLNRKTLVFPCLIKNNYFRSCIRQDLLFNTKSVNKRGNGKRNQQTILVGGEKISKLAAQSISWTSIFLQSMLF